MATSDTYGLNPSALVNKIHHFKKIDQSWKLETFINIK